MVSGSKVTVPVSKTNFNRHRYHTMSLKRILEIEGFRVVEGSNVVDEKGSQFSIYDVELVIRSKGTQVLDSVPDFEGLARVALN